MSRFHVVPWALLGMVLGALPQVLAAQSVTVDASTAQGPLPQYEHYLSTILSTRGPSDKQLVKDLGVAIERTFYLLPEVCPSEGSYNFGFSYGSVGGGTIYGGDPLLDDIIAQGAQPLVCLDRVPAWLSTAGDTNSVPRDWAKWETMIRDILNHLHGRYPALQYVELFNESFTPNSDFTAGTQGWYWDAFFHTSNALRAVNAQGANFKLGGTVTTVNQVNLSAQMMDQATSMGAQLDFISYHTYSNDPNFAPSIAAQVQAAAQARGLNLPQFITEWGAAYYLAPNNSNTADIAAYVATSWKSFANTGLGEQVRPMWFSLNNYALQNFSVLAYNDPDGTVFPVYNVFKMLSMMKPTRLATSGNALGSTDGTTVTIMVVGGATVTVNNLPGNFQRGIHFQQYLVDEQHSNYLFSSSNHGLLEQVGDSQLSGGTSVTVSVSTTGSGVNLIVLTGGTGGTPPPPPPPPSSGIQDPGFEQQTQASGAPLIPPWSREGSAAIGVDDSNGIGGSKCGYIYDSGTGAWSAITQMIGVSPNTTYTLSCYLQTDPVFAAQGLMGVRKTDGTLLASRSYGQMTNYTQISVTFNSGSSISVVIFAGFTDTGAGSWIHLDNWRLGSGGGTTSSSNMIQDPSFEHQTQAAGAPLIAPWSGVGPAEVGVDDTSGVNTSHCAYIYDSGTGAWSAVTQTVAVHPNTNYTLSCWIQTDASFPAQGSMGAQAPDGTILASQSYGQMTNYTQLTISFNSGSSSSVVVFAGFVDQGAGAWIHVDNWSMVDPPGAAIAGTPPGGVASAGGSGGKAACGLTGLETVLVLGLLALRRRRA